MSFFELAKKRRSVRKFGKQNIKREDLKLCVESARHAPSACNSQPWKFIIIDDPDAKKNFKNGIFSNLYGMNTFAEEAAAFIALVSEDVKPPAWIGGKFKGTDFKQIDAGIAASYLVLAAEELGIGSCILGWFDERKLKKILAVPASKRIPLIIALGYSAQGKPSEKKFKDEKEVVSYNRY